MNFKRAVADGYDAIADRLVSERGGGSTVAPWLHKLSQTLPARARILDLGCGAGIPHTAILAQRFQVIGVDISSRQLALASNNVPNAHFVLADMASIDFQPASFDAVTAIYSIIHVPRDEQPALLAAIRRWLKPSGRTFLVLGANDTPAGYEADWFGAPMLWSHFSAERSLAMLVDAGFRILFHDLVTDPLDPRGRHLFALCRAS